MNAILLTIPAGIVATLVMSFTMYLVHWSKLANADMIRAIGGLLSKHKPERAFRVGIITHAIAGAMFAFPYAIMVSIFPDGSFYQRAGIGGLLGFFHGFIFSFFLIVMVAENHPDHSFQKAGLSVAGAHVLGHFIYGLTMGILVYLLQIDFFPR